MAALNDKVSAISQLSDLLLGSSKTTSNSGGTKTSGLDVSADGINAILRQILEGTGGNQGLASVAYGQRQSGMYNSTVTQQLINDLLTRSAGEVGKLTAKTVETVSPTTVTQKVDPVATNKNVAKVGATLTGIQLLSKLLGNQVAGAAAKTATKKLGIDKAVNDGINGAVDSVESVFTPATSSMADTVTSSMGLAGADGAQVVTPSMAELGSSYFGQDTADNIFNSISDYSTTGSTAGLDALSNSFLDVGYDSTIADAIWSDSASTAVTDNIPGVGSAVSYYNAADQFFSGDNKTQAVGEAVGTYIGGPVGGAVGSWVGKEVTPIATSIDDGIHDAGSWIDDNVTSKVSDALGCFITTAVCKYYHKPDDCYELETLRTWRDSWLIAEHPEEIKKYYAEAPLIVARIEARSDAGEVFQSFYTGYILPALDAIEAGCNKTAYAIYRSLFSLASYEAEKGV